MSWGSAERWNLVAWTGFSPEKSPGKIRVDSELNTPMILSCVTLREALTSLKPNPSAT